MSTHEKGPSGFPEGPFRLGERIGPIGGRMCQSPHRPNRHESQRQLILSRRVLFPAGSIRETHPVGGTTSMTTASSGTILRHLHQLSRVPSAHELTDRDLLQRFI